MFAVVHVNYNAGDPGEVLRKKASAVAGVPTYDDTVSAQIGTSPSTMLELSIVRQQKERRGAHDAKVSNNTHSAAQRILLFSGPNLLPLWRGRHLRNIKYFWMIKSALASLGGVLMEPFANSKRGRW